MINFGVNHFTSGAAFLRFDTLFEAQEPSAFTWKTYFCLNLQVINCHIPDKVADKVVANAPSKKVAGAPDWTGLEWINRNYTVSDSNVTSTWRFPPPPDARSFVWNKLKQQREELEELQTKVARPLASPREHVACCL